MSSTDNRLILPVTGMLSVSISLIFVFLGEIQKLLQSYGIEDEELLSSQVPMIVQRMDPSGQGKILRSQFLRVAHGMLRRKKAKVVVVVANADGVAPCSF